MRMLRLPSGGLDTRLLGNHRTRAHYRRPPPEGRLQSPVSCDPLWAVLPYLPTYLPGYLPTYYLLTYYLHTYPPTYLPTYPPSTYLPYLPVLRSGGYRRVGLTDRLID